MNRRAIFASAALKLNLAKSSRFFLSVALFGLGFGASAAYALDGSRSPANIAPAVGPAQPQWGMDSGYLRDWLRAGQLGDMDAARKFLENAARDGDVGAAWELGRMYSDGAGVKQSHRRAFEYFNGIADSHADETPGTGTAVFVAKAFVALGGYYLTGIPNSDVKPDPIRAHDMFNYAATHFGDPDAQYHLGRMYLDGQGVGKDTEQAIRWLSLAADKGQYQAQAVLGALSFRSCANIAPAIGPAAALYPGNLKAYFRARDLGDIETARKLLEDAARDGAVGAAWKLGRMYADGDGVEQSDLRAFEYFRCIADSHADEVRGTEPAVFVAKAFVEIGRYYLTGIVNYIKPDAVRAREVFSHAASYFGDPDAQYHLGRMYLDGQGVGKDTKQGIRWLSLAADKGQYQSQAVLGALLFKGQFVSRDGAQGLMWLMLARDAATPGEAWITDQYTAAWKQATEAERRKARGYLEKWIEEHGGRRQ
jgi:uncharacterized protein